MANVSINLTPEAYKNLEKIMNAITGVEISLEGIDSVRKSQITLSEDDSNKLASISDFIELQTKIGISSSEYKRIADTAEVNSRLNKKSLASVILNKVLTNGKVSINGDFTTGIKEYSRETGKAHPDRITLRRFLSYSIHLELLKLEI